MTEYFKRHAASFKKAGITILAILGAAFVFMTIANK